jgi:hypothetical protein
MIHTCKHIGIPSTNKYICSWRRERQAEGKAIKMVAADVAQEPASASASSQPVCCDTLCDSTWIVIVALWWQVTVVDKESEGYKKAMQKLLACKRNDLKGDTSSRTTCSTKPKVLTQCIAHVLAIKNCAAGYEGLWAWHARWQGPGEDEQQDCKGQVKSGWSLVKMLHTWQNAAYLGNLNFGKTFGKKFGKSVMT